MMPTPDPSNSEHNAFVQDWLGEWAKEHTVYGKSDWELAAMRKIVSNPGWAKQFNVTIAAQVHEASIFEQAIESIQDTYNYEDHEAKKHKVPPPSELRDAEVYVLTTFLTHSGVYGLYIDQEVFSAKPTFDLEPNMMLRVANIDGGDSATASMRPAPPRS